MSAGVNNRKKKKEPMARLPISGNLHMTSSSMTPSIFFAFEERRGRVCRLDFCWSKRSSNQQVVTSTGIVLTDEKRDSNKFLVTPISRF